MSHRHKYLARVAGKGSQARFGRRRPTLAAGQVMAAVGHVFFLKKKILTKPNPLSNTGIEDILLYFSLLY